MPTTVVDTEVTVSDMQPVTVSSRPIRSVKMQQGWVAAGGAIAVLGFFLPWVKTWLNFGPEMGSDSGFSFAKVTESVSSGNSLAILWIALIAGALALAAAAYSGFVRLDSRSYRGVCGIQAVLNIAGIVVIWITLPGEIDTWSGLVVEYQVGIWLTTIGLAVAGLAALVGMASRR